MRVTVKLAAPTSITSPWLVGEIKRVTSTRLESPEIATPRSGPASVSVLTIARVAGSSLISRPVPCVVT